MNKLYAVIILFLVGLTSKAQVTIVNTDLQNANDTFRVSNGNLFPAVDFTTTGPNSLWDFSTLNYSTQDVDSFLPLPTSITYLLTFGFGTNSANIVQKSNTFAGIPGGTLPISNIINLYKKSSTVYKQVGNGATLTGLDIPMAFTNHDIIYHLPLHYNDQDSSNSDGSISIPNTAYFGFNRTRVNHVDGWGTLITPYGTFNALRMRSVVNEFDTLFADTLGFGFGFPQPEVVEYKWLVPGKGIPVLQINTTSTFGVETVSSIRYRDSIRYAGINEMVNLSSFNIAPNPANENSLISFELQKTADVTLTLYGVDGKKSAILENKRLLQGVHNYYLLPESLKLSNGVYILELLIDGRKNFKKVVFAD